MSESLPTNFQDEHRTRFIKRLQSVGYAAGAPVWLDIERAYNEPHRCYHSASHIIELLQIFDTEWFQKGSLLHLLQNRPVRTAFELAIWWHDAVYQTAVQAPGLSNERASACWAYTVLHQAGAGINVVANTYSFVMATAHPAPHNDNAFATWMTDLDLAILGSDEYRFPLYEAEISAEYGHVHYPDYLRGRADFLEQFLQSRDYIYQTAPFRDRYEDRAQDNVKGLIAQLKSHLKEIERHGSEPNAET